MSGHNAPRLCEHRPHQALEQIDRLIRKARDQIQHGRSQGGVPTPRLVASDMLRRRAAGLARKLSEARLMHTMRARRVLADRAHMIEPLDQAEHRRRLGRFRHLPQPGQPAVRGFRATIRQGIEPPQLFG